MDNTNPINPAPTPFPSETATNPATPPLTPSPDPAPSTTTTSTTTTNPSILTPSPVVETNSAPGGSSGSKKKMFIFLMLLILVLAGAAAAYFFLVIKAKQTEPEPTAAPESQLQTPTPISTSYEGIPIKENTVSFTKSLDGKIILSYKGKYFEEQKAESGEPVEVAVSSPEAYTWLGLVEAPVDLDPNTPANAGVGDEIFSFKALPDGNQFIFVMRWTTADKQRFEVYHFDNTQVKNIASYTLPSQDNKPSVPKIAKVSADGMYVSMHLFSCWNCGGHQPETLLFNLADTTSKNIGKVSFFEWGEAGAYTYKEYKVKTCETESAGECFEDPATLPSKSGEFNSSS